MEWRKWEWTSDPAQLYLMRNCGIDDMRLLLCRAEVGRYHCGARTGVANSKANLHRCIKDLDHNFIHFFVINSTYNFVLSFCNFIDIH